MARRISSMTTLTPTATPDATDLANGTYPHLVQGGSSTQVCYIWEVSLSGQAPSAASPCIMLLSYDSQVGTGTNTSLSGQTDVATNPATAALSAPAKTGNQWGTNKPQRSSSLHLANYSVNAYGGNAFWRANRVEECFQTLGNVASLGEVSLSAFTGGSTGLLGSHLTYESL